MSQNKWIILGAEILDAQFSCADAQRAHDEWGCNCGPGALAGLLGCTLDQIRPWMGDFESKRYTNPTLMFSILRSLGMRWTNRGQLWPSVGLARIQWHGPWMAEGVPVQARYRHTHWVATAGCGIFEPFAIFDINCINNGTGWVSFDEWQSVLVPWLTRHTNRADGKWSITHGLQFTAAAIMRARSRVAAAPVNEATSQPGSARAMPGVPVNTVGGAQ